MERASEHGLEVALPMDPEVATQPDEYKYYTRGRVSDYPNLDQPDQSHQAQAKSQGQSRVILVLIIIAIICLAAALGAGLGAGLAVQHKSSSSRLVCSLWSGSHPSVFRDTYPLSPYSGANVNNTPAYGTFIPETKTSNAPVTVVHDSGAPKTVARSDKVTTTISTSATLPPLVCPPANGSTYIATNKPLPTLDVKLGWQIPNTSLSFEILCNTDFCSRDGGATDLQVIANVSSLSDCLDKCALYSFQTKAPTFPAMGCTGIALSLDADPLNPSPSNTCWLKGNVTLETLNDTIRCPGFDGAVLLIIWPRLMGYKPWHRFSTFMNHSICGIGRSDVWVTRRCRSCILSADYGQVGQEYNPAMLLSSPHMQPMQITLSSWPDCLTMA